MILKLGLNAILLALFSASSIHTSSYVCRQKSRIKTSTRVDSHTRLMTRLDGDFMVQMIIGMTGTNNNCAKPGRGDVLRIFGVK